MTLIKNAFYLAWTDTRARYKKSILGPLWLTLGNLIGILGLNVVWASLLKEEMNTFVPSLTIGMIVWQLVAGSIGEGPATFIRHANIIRNVAIPSWFFVIRALSRQLINFAHNLLIMVVVVWYFDYPLQAQMWLVAPGMLLIILNLFWIIYLLGLLGARFRDVEYLINALLPLLFFMSPVIFRPDRLPVDMNIVWLNPFSYFIEVVRAPIMGTTPDSKGFIVMGGMLLAGGIITFLINQRYGRKLAFWV
ncbi:ABC transporter permease [Zoogloea sp.]|uniref:ABC transporter permease n=1 Tax=Zoogloea sp. TaxID=49181 RepID=UPI0035B08CEF